MKPWPRLRALLRKNKLDAEMAEEMRLHLELQAEKNIAAGMNSDDARHAARRQFGHVDGIKEQCRDQRGWLWFEQALQDVRYAARALRKTPGFTMAAILTLGIGIGVNSTTFSLINDLILQPYFRDRQENLVALQSASVGGDRSYRPFNYAEFTALRNAHDVFRDVAAMQFGSCLLGDGDDVQRRLLCLVSESYFAVQGVRPLRGRFFSAEEASPSARSLLMVASYDLWQRLGGAENFLGSSVRIDGRDYTVIGIAPAGFGGLHWSNGPDAWLPLGLASTMAGFWGSRAPAGGLLDPQWRVLQLFADLKPGLTLLAARGLLPSLSAQLNSLSGVKETEKRELLLRPPPRINLDLTSPAEESRLTIYAAAGIGMTIIVLLIACLNVANMLFGRSITRQREISIRLCLGASRGRVVRQLLREGLLLSRWSNHLLLDLSGRHSGPMILHLRTTLNWPMLLGTFVLCLVATLVVSLAPALRAPRRDLVADLKKQAGEPTSLGRWNRFFSLRHCLAMTQLALSLLLVFSAGLLVRSVMNSEHDRGFETDGQLIADLDYYLANTPKEAVPLRQRAVLERASRLPGVESAALASGVPYNFESNNRRVFAVGQRTIGAAARWGSSLARRSSVTIISVRWGFRCCADAISRKLRRWKQTPAPSPSSTTALAARSSATLIPLANTLL